MIDKSFVEKIEQMVETKEIKLDGRTYTNKAVHPVKKEIPDTLVCRNLSSIVNYVKKNIDVLKESELLIHVADEETVYLVSKLDNNWNDREVYLKASMDGFSSEFKFGEKYDAERFNIALQTNFIQTKTTEAVLKIVGNLKSEKVMTSVDDGKTQKVQVNIGITRVDKEEIPNPVMLKPYRTFREVDQPESAFVLRMFNPAQEGLLPSCALFEADGSTWKNTAIANIKGYFEKELPTIAVVA